MKAPTTRRVRTALFVLVAAVVLVDMGPGYAGTLDDIRGELDRVRTQREEIDARMQETQDRLETLHARVATLEIERDDLLREVEAHELEIEDLAQSVAHRVREVFKHGSALDPVAVFLSSDDAVGALNRAATVQRIVDGDRSRSEDLVAAQVRASAARDRLDQRSADLEASTEEFGALEAALQQDLNALQALEAGLSDRERAELDRIARERREREERERRAQQAAAEARAAEAAAAPPAPAPSAPAEPSSASPSSGSLHCPIGRPHSFIDSWGHARSGGRRHRGTDMMAPHGVSIHAVTDGVWEHRRQGASAGIWGVLRGDDGDAYWYMHLSGHTVGNGARVSGGTRVATNGSTGNASTPHLHFELHPGGGGAVNPYPFVRRLC
ncbi:MAG: peptidoglycan DD-metalloendopeptidase family protein [Nitriliruptoraceae bacterium]